MDAAMFSSLNIVLHVADEERFVRYEVVFLKDLVNFFALVPNIEIRLIEVFVEAGDCGLHREMIAMYRAQQKGAHAFGAAELEKFARVRQFANGILDLFEAAMEPRFELRQLDIG